MAYDYTIKGWPATITFGAAVFTVTSADGNDNDLIYVGATRYPHITIHGLDKEGPSVWKRRGGDFHVKLTRNRLFEYDRNGPNDFVTQRGQQTTGTGTVAQVADALTMSQTFRNAIDAL